MFNECTSFNQPLNTWNVARVTVFIDAFRDTNITEENKPIFVIVPARVRVRVRAIRVDANQSHREAAKINYAKLNSFLKEKSGSVDVPADLNFPKFINESLTKIINESDETEVKKKEETSGLKNIMTQRLNGVNYSELSSYVRASIYYSLEYLKKQPDDFKKIYVHAFIHDCVHAYNGEAGMTCAGGALERIIFSFTPPCQSSASEGKENKEYETLVAIITANPEKLIEEYIDEDEIDLMKIDIEGSEYDFFETITDENLKKIKKLVIEYHNNDNYKAMNILKKLTCCGFKFKLSKWSPQCGDYIIENKMGVIYAEKI
jgi:surface protein